MAIASQRTIKPAKVLVLGMGDLGAQIARIVAENGFASELMLAGQSAAAFQWSRLLHVTTGQKVDARQVDALDVEALKKLLTEFEPELIVQCASLMSPFALAKSESAAAKAILRGGFALQASAQIPLIRSLMLARKAVGLQCPVVNCSYPDLTHPVLAAEGLSPTCGIGNVAIMAMRFKQLLPGAANGELRVIGHHAQLMPSLRAEAPLPIVYLNGERVADEKLLLQPVLLGGSTLNYLAASTGKPIVEGLLGEEPLETHAPGVFGLPGGYPVRFAAGEVSMDFPSGITQDEAVAFNKQFAAHEGIAGVDESGTLTYTEFARSAVAEAIPEIAEPLNARNVMQRFEVLKSALV